MVRPVIRLLTTFAALALVLAPAARANVLVNGNAETGDLSGWTDALGNGFAVWFTGSPPAQEGLFCFHGGTNGPSGARANEIRQDLNVSSLASSIDAGSVVALFSCYARSGQSLGVTCSARAIVEFRTTGGTVLQSYDSGVVLPVNTWLAANDSRPVPILTRAIRVRLVASRPSGTSTDAYFDAASFQLDVPVPSGTSTWGRIKRLYR